jgi:hypothetical protein
MTAKPTTNGVNRAGLWASIATSGFLLLGTIGSIFYIGFKVQITADTQEARGKRLYKIDERLAVLDDRLTKIEVAQNEVETQFCASDIVRNLMHANDQRTSAVMWEKVFGTKYPTDNSYYPTICNRRGK